jgi:hypothetical protein
MAGPVPAIHDVKTWMPGERFATWPGMTTERTG